MSELFKNLNALDYTHSFEEQIQGYTGIDFNPAIYGGAICFKDYNVVAQAITLISEGEGIDLFWLRELHSEFLDWWFKREEDNQWYLYCSEIPEDHPTAVEEGLMWADDYRLRAPCNLSTVSNIISKWEANMGHPYEHVEDLMNTLSFSKVEESPNPFISLKPSNNRY